MDIEEILKNKKIVATGIVIVLLVVGLVGIRIGSSGSKKSQKEAAQEEVLPETEAVPTVDSSVEVNVEANAAKNELTLSISNFPEGTETIEYELAYETGSGLLQGIPGTIKNVAGKHNVTRSGLTLGTCSSGTCKYDTGVKSVTATIKFIGDYGTKLFEKEFEL